MLRPTRPMARLVTIVPVLIALALVGCSDEVTDVSEDDPNDEQQFEQAIDDLVAE